MQEVILKQEGSRLTITNGNGKEAQYPDDKTGWGDALMLATMKVLLARHRREEENINLIIELNGERVLFKAVQQSNEENRN